MFLLCERISTLPTLGWQTSQDCGYSVSASLTATAPVPRRPKRMDLTAPSLPKHDLILSYGHHSQMLSLTAATGLWMRESDLDTQVSDGRNAVAEQPHRCGGLGPSVRHAGRCRRTRAAPGWRGGRRRSRVGGDGSDDHGAADAIASVVGFDCEAQISVITVLSLAASSVCRSTGTDGPAVSPPITSPWDAATSANAGDTSMSLVQAAVRASSRATGWRGSAPRTAVRSGANRIRIVRAGRARAHEADPL
ncbi:hypothetical protein BJY24_005760 [Nocardia transvalensis]|uniref:Uncharacterized protein n=1 Tax=Nocardia transvalensis TaxID=37333 RepID=A0A7W9UKS1_9NOCA|nr:hypothetical protein [Nocardia transvalensis]